jgi:hypothetical protein
MAIDPMYWSPEAFESDKRPSSLFRSAATEIVRSAAKVIAGIVVVGAALYAGSKTVGPTDPKNILADMKKLEENVGKFEHTNTSEALRAIRAAQEICAGGVPHKAGVDPLQCDKAGATALEEASKAMKANNTMAGDKMRSLITLNP